MEVDKNQVVDLTKKNSELEDDIRQLKAVIEQHLATVKIKRNDTANMAYIRSSNAIRAAHRTNLDLEGIRAQMRDMLVPYMRNNPVRIQNHLPLKDLVAFGKNFDFLLEGANFYNPRSFENGDRGR